MNLKHYDFFNINNNRAYEFYSEGPKGKIKKLITFTKIPEIEPIIYNLAFGDANLDTGELNDKIVSNNQDVNLILATVANAVAEFCDHYGNHYIYAEGSTPSRTRLYQISIAGLWKQINEDFDIYGLKDTEWQQFKPNSVNYEAFLVKRK